MRKNVNANEFLIAQVVNPRGGMNRVILKFITPKRITILTVMIS